MSRMITIQTLCLMTLLAVGCQGTQTQLHNTTSNISGFSARLMDLVTGNTPVKAAAKMEDRDFPDERRQGINRLVARDFGKRDPYTKRYEQLAANDPDYLVRATAIRALNRSHDLDATPIYIKALDDSSDQVRLEAVKALGNMPDDKALPGLVKIINNTSDQKDVRIAAADALKHYKSLEVARALVNTLSERDFGVAWQARRSLTAITGHDLAYDEAAWLSYLTGPEKPFG